MGGKAIHPDLDDGVENPPGRMFGLILLVKLIEGSHLMNDFPALGVRVRYAAEQVAQRQQQRTLGGFIDQHFVDLATEPHPGFDHE